MKRTTIDKALRENWRKITQPEPLPAETVAAITAGIKAMSDLKSLADSYRHELRRARDTITHLKGAIGERAHEYTSGNSSRTYHAAADERVSEINKLIGAT